MGCDWTVGSDAIGLCFVWLARLHTVVIFHRLDAIGREPERRHCGCGVGEGAGGGQAP